MSFFKRLLNSPVPKDINSLIAACDVLCNEGKFAQAVTLSEAYGDRLFDSGDITQPNEFYELGISHLLVMAAAHGKCAKLSGKKLEDTIVAIAGRRRYVHDLLGRASIDKDLFVEAQRNRDIADATINDLEERYGQKVDVQRLIAKADLLFFSHSG